MIDSSPVIQVMNLKKTYRTGLLRRRVINALQGVTLEIPRGRIYGLLGPNGAGKTTLIKILLGIVRRSSGDAKVLGMPAGRIAARRRIGYLPENHRIPRHLTGQTALEYYGCLSGMPLGEVRRRIPELIDKVGLRGRDRDRVSGYSKGMQQRLGLAQAMLHNPELIILDEPTDGVDPVGRTEIREVLRGLAADGTSIFLNSHLLQEIELICESVAILQQGRLRHTGAIRDLTKAVAESPIVFHLAGSRESISECVHENDVRSFDSAEKSAGTEETQEFLLDIVLTEQAATDALVDRLRGKGISILRMGRRQLTLEEAFMQLIGEDEQ